MENHGSYRHPLTEPVQRIHRRPQIDIIGRYRILSGRNGVYTPPPGADRAKIGSAEEREYTRVLIDATRKWPYPPVALPQRQYMERTWQIWIIKTYRVRNCESRGTVTHWVIGREVAGVRETHCTGRIFKGRRRNGQISGGGERRNDGAGCSEVNCLMASGTSLLLKR